MNKTLFWGVTAILLPIWLLGCAGGGESGTGLNEDNVSVGAITGFGSVLVNGIKFETTQSKFTVNEMDGSEDDLKVGMLVKISGEIDLDGTTGRAAKITFSRDISGPVTGNSNLVNDELEVMGQTVKISPDTVFESQVSTINLFSELETGNFVEVSGYSSGAGTIYATRIELKSTQVSIGEEIDVKGVISNLDSTAKVFTLGSSLSVNYENAELELDGFNLANNLYVEVKSVGGIDSQTGILFASEVELEEGGKKQIEVEENKEVELEGFVSGYDSVNNQFNLNGQLVQINNNTEINNGAIQDGDKVEVKGNVINNILIAEEIEKRVVSNTKLSGIIDEVNSSNQTITILGDRVIQINSLTSVEDEREGISEESRKYFNFNQLEQGQFVEVVVFYDSSTDSFIATRLELDDAEEVDSSDGSNDSSSEVETQKLELEGELQEINLTNMTITVAGVTVNFTDAQILEELNVGDEVSLDASYPENSPSELTLLEIELED